MVIFYCLYTWSVYVKNEENRHRTLILSIQVRSFFNEFHPEEEGDDGVEEGQKV